MEGLAHTLSWLILNDLAFTLVMALVSLFFKAFAQGQQGIWQRIDTYDLGLELVFMALSFAVSNLAQQLNRLQNLGPTPATDLAALAHAAVGGLTLLCVCLVGLTVCMALLQRHFGYQGALLQPPPARSKPHRLRGIVVPNFLGALSLALVITYTNQLP